MLFVNHTQTETLILLSEKEKATAFAVAFSSFMPEGLVVAAATEHNNYCKDYNPSAVIVEKMA